MRSPTAFISYSHDSDVHREHVLALANKLRHDGVDVILDRYESAPPQGWAHWMQDQVTRADFVLMICTETYDRRLMKREQPGLGLGGVWEGHLIVTSFFEAGAGGNKFIPVLLSRDDEQWVPLPFRAVHRYILDSADGYEALYRYLTGQPSVQKPTLGALAPLPMRQASWNSRPETKMFGLPASPRLFLGRERSVIDFKRVAGVLPGSAGSTDPARVTSIVGLPGVGKTTFVSALPHDADIRATYPDGILWMAFGQANPRDLQVSLQSTLSDWAVEWNGTETSATKTLPQMLQQWRERLRERRILLIIDDVWDADLAHRITSVVEAGSSAVITCRTPVIAERVVPLRELRYKLEELDPEDALLLLMKLAPDVVAQHREDCAILVEDLGRLPLAIVAAGGLLGSDRGRAVGFFTLLSQIRKGKALLETDAPADMVPVLAETRPSVAALLQRSLQVLDAVQQAQFAKLAVFAPKPATIDLPMMAMVWQVTPGEAADTAGLFVDHGILQATWDGKFQLHAVLSKLAYGMLQAL